MLPLQIAHQILTHRHWGEFSRAFELCQLILHFGARDSLAWDGKGIKLLRGVEFD